MCDCGYEFASGTLGVQRAGVGMPQRERAAIADTADRYRTLVATAFVQALAGGSGRALILLLKRNENDQAVLVASLVSLGLVVSLAAYVATLAHRVAIEMKLRGAGGWAATVLVGGIFGVMLMNSWARQWSERFGIKFGILGPNRQDIERFARGR
jgi:hypothetical protein